MDGVRRTGPWGAAGVVLAILAGSAPACVLDLRNKHGCHGESDCLAGRACVDFVCRASSEKSDAASDAGNARDAETGEASGEAAPPSDGGDAETGDAASPFPTRPPRFTSQGTPNYMFVTSEKFPTNFGSLEAADEKCNGAARAAGLPGKFRAWLSTTQVDARDRIKDASGWIRPDGAPFADQVSDIVEGTILFPPLVDERGKEVRTLDPVATGTTADGRFGSYNCDDWTNTPGMLVVAGTTLGTSKVWTVLDRLPCGAPMRIYCFGIDQNAQVGVQREEGKRAFVSVGIFVTNTGVEGADRLCATEGTALTPPGTFKALLATSKASAASRFPGTGRRWVRLDGAPLNESGQELFRDGVTVAPLNMTSAGELKYALVATGAKDLSLKGSATDTCSDWTVSSNDSLGGIFGIASYMPGWLDIPGLASCAPNGFSVYCLEE